MPREINGLYVFKISHEDLVIQSLVLILCCEVFIFCTLQWFLISFIQYWCKYPALEWEGKGTRAPAQSLLMSGSNTALAAWGRGDWWWQGGPWCTQGMRWGPTALSSTAQVQCPASACAQLLIYWIAVIYSAQQNNKLCFYVVLQMKPLKELSGHFKLFLWQLCCRLHP